MSGVDAWKTVISASQVEASTPAIFSADAEASSKSTPTSTRETFSTGLMTVLLLVLAPRRQRSCAASGGS